MSEDRLTRATRALRDVTLSSPEASRTQLERALSRLERSTTSVQPLRRAVQRVVWTLGATFIGVGAWANATGRVHWFAPPNVDRAPDRVAQAQTSAPAAGGARPSSEPAVAEPAVPEAAVPEAAVPEAAVPEPPSAREPEPARALAQRSPGPRPRAREVARATLPPPPAPALPPSAEEDLDALYQTAHTAHFVQGDYRAALVAWDRYLARAKPSDRWLLEARFNRAVALYRLGQSDAARQALTPFASGQYGGYRREAARRLIDALGSTR